MGHAVCKCAYFNSRKRVFGLLVSLCIVTVIIMVSYSARSRFIREVWLEDQIVILQNRIQFLQKQFREKQEEAYYYQEKSMGKLNISSLHGNEISTFSPEVISLLQNISGSKAAEAAHPSALPESIRAPYSYQLLPHLMDHPQSLKPAYLMSGGRSYSNVVIGIPTVKRDKESYLLTTIGHLIQGLDDSNYNSTLIVVMVGEKELNYVITVARTIELTYPQHVDSGLIEVISPHPSYYPDLDKLPATLGDSHKRVMWRTKQNLDVLYLMSYSIGKGVYYLMLEDDVIARTGYMQDILKSVAQYSKKNMKTPWFFINFSTIGGIGKLFKTSDLQHFITYVQLFYVNMPIDWLLESYLADRVCGIDKTTKKCGELKAQIRPTYKVGLFEHIGLYSSLKGKLQKVKDKRYGSLPEYYPHKNPPVKKITCTISHHKEENSIENAYKGKNYFWGVKPQKGDVIEFWFEQPLDVARFLFRSGNLEHVTDKFTDAVVEALPADPHGNFTTVGYFDEFGLADGDIPATLLPLSCLRIRVNEETKFWVIVNEIDIRTSKDMERS